MARLLDTIRSKPLLFGGLFFVFVLSIFTFFETTRLGMLESKLVQIPETVPLAQDQGTIRTVQVLTGHVVDESEEQSAVSEKQQGRQYPITDGETYRISGGRKYVCENTFWSDSAHIEILEIKVNGKWKELFRTKDLGDNNCFSILSIYEKSIRLSPLGDYVEFSLVGYEWSDDMLINTKTKKNLFPKDTHSSGLLWSKSARNFAFISNLEEFGGSGVDRIVTSKFNNPEILVNVFDLKSWAKDEYTYNLKYEFRDLKFIDNQTIEFSIHRVYDEDETKLFGEIAQYRYDLEKGELKEIFRK